MALGYEGSQKGSHDTGEAVAESIYDEDCVGRSVEGMAEGI